MTGVFLVFFYSNDVSLAFSRVQYLIYESNYGWLIRICHFNGASLFFFFIYLHFFKALFYFRYRLKIVWLVGLFILLIFIMEAFLGYVLVWAQISFWAAVVITSLLSVIPFYGFKIVFWIWGGFSVSSATLKFFFVLHFLIPWLCLILVLLHLIFLHSAGSSSKIICFIYVDKVNFYPYFWLKDFLNLFLFVVFFFCCWYGLFIWGTLKYFWKRIF